MAEKAFQRPGAGSGQGEAAARPRAAVHRAASGADRPPAAAQPSIGSAVLARMLGRAGHQHGAEGGPPDRAVFALQPGIGNAALARMLGQARHAPAAVQRSAVHDVLSGSGQPLAAPLREEMQARLGADLSHVRVHTDGAARASAAEVGARAYTSGSHVVIGDGGADKHTLAHELTHVIQQRQGPVAGTDHGGGFKVSDPFDAYEKAAEVNAARVMRAPLSQYRLTATGTGEQCTPAVQRTRLAAQRGGSSTTQPAAGTKVGDVLWRATVKVNNLPKFNESGVVGERVFNNPPKYLEADVDGTPYRLKAGQDFINNVKGLLYMKDETKISGADAKLMKPTVNVNEEEEGNDVRVVGDGHHKLLFKAYHGEGCPGVIKNLFYARAYEWSNLKWQEDPRAKKEPEKKEPEGE